jgi:hypothetical protein
MTPLRRFASSPLEGRRNRRPVLSVSKDGSPGSLVKTTRFFAPRDLDL